MDKFSIFLQKFNTIKDITQDRQSVPHDVLYNMSVSYDVLYFQDEFFINWSKNLFSVTYGLI